MCSDHHATPEAAQPPHVDAEEVDGLGIPKSCGKPLCSPGEHHPLCSLADRHTHAQRKAMAPQYLAPCPFCGKSLHAKWDWLSPLAQCATADCLGGKLPPLNLAQQSDIDSWNTRMGLNVSSGAPREMPADQSVSPGVLPPDGYLNWWPAPGGGFDVIWSATNGAARMIGCHHEPVYRPRTLALMGFRVLAAEGEAKPKPSD